MGKRFAGRPRSVILAASDDLRRNLRLGPPFGGKSVGADAAETATLLENKNFP